MTSPIAPDVPCRFSIVVFPYLDQDIEPCMFSTVVFWEGKELYHRLEVTCEHCAEHKTFLVGKDGESRSEEPANWTMQHCWKHWDTATWMKTVRTLEVERYGRLEATCEHCAAHDSFAIGKDGNDGIGLTPTGRSWNQSASVNWVINHRREHRTKDVVMVHADGGKCHGTPLVNGRCPMCHIVPDMQSCGLWSVDDVKRASPL